MAVTFARTGYDYDVTSVPAPDPGGSGGRVVVAIVSSSTSSTAPDVPGDWGTAITSAVVSTGARVWVSNGPSPDLGFTIASGEEAGVAAWRIDDATGVYASATGDYQWTTTDIHFPDVASAPDGVALAIIGDGSEVTLTSPSLSWVADYEGDAGAAGWWAADAHLFRLEGVTPGGGTFDPGSITASAAPGLDMITLVIETGGGGTAALTQSGYRFGTDDGTEAGHGWEAAEDTPVTMPAEVTRLLRVQENETGGGADTDGRMIEYRLVGDTDWEGVV